MQVPITILTQNETLSRAKNGSRAWITWITELWTSVFCEQCVCWVDLFVTSEAEFGWISSAVKQSFWIIAEVAETSLGMLGWGVLSGLVCLRIRGWRRIHHFVVAEVRKQSCWREEMRSVFKVLGWWIFPFGQKREQNEKVVILWKDGRKQLALAFSFKDADNIVHLTCSHLGY